MKKIRTHVTDHNIRRRLLVREMIAVIGGVETEPVDDSESAKLPGRPKTGEVT